MTQIPISEIPEEGLPLSYSEEAAELDLAVPGARFLQPIAVDLVLVKAAGEISAHGRIKTSVMCECVRCLSQFPVPLDILVATQFRPALPPLPPGESRMPSSASKNKNTRTMWWAWTISSGREWSWPSPSVPRSAWTSG